MKKLSRAEMMNTEGGDVIKKAAAWLKKQWCQIKNHEAPEKTWSGNGNNVWL